MAIGFLQIGQAYIKSTREERLETEKLIQVVLPAKDVIWEEEGRELWVGDKIFDVASYKVVDGDYHMTGVFDEDETEVAGSLLHILFSKKGTDLLQLLLLLQCFSAALFLFELALRYNSRQLDFPEFLSHLLSLPQLVLVPPPQQ
ncbi:MAG TPA: hypothetical protein VER36_08195 [Flavisolibacter sp.]|nr:hypothetical protein [Flavisolibacter sp.]